MQRNQPSSFTGVIYLKKVTGTKLAVEDVVANSSDPYFVLKYPNGETFKSKHLNFTTEPTWDLTCTWSFSNLTFSSVFEIEVWDWDLVGSDDLIGKASFTFSGFCHFLNEPGQSGFKVDLRIPKNPEAERGTVELFFRVDSAEVLNNLLFASDSDHVCKGIAAMGAKLWRLDSSEPSWWTDTYRFERMVQLATTPSSYCKEALVNLLPSLNSVIIAMDPVSSLVPQVKGALLRLWNTDAARIEFLTACLKPLTTYCRRAGAADVIRIELAPLIAEAVPVLLKELVSDVVLLLFEFLEATPEATALHTPTIRALEDLCLNTEFWVKHAQAAGRAVCTAYVAAGNTAVLVGDTAQIARLERNFTTWLTCTKVDTPREVYIKAFETLRYLLDATRIFDGKALPLQVQRYWTPATRVTLRGAVPLLPEEGPKAVELLQRIGGSTAATATPAVPVTPAPATDSPDPARTPSPASSVSSGAEGGSSPERVPSPSPVAISSSARLVVEQFLPQEPPVSVDHEANDYMYEFLSKRVTFVQEAVDQKPFVLAAAALQVPARCDFPTSVVMIWAADRLPDLADLEGVKDGGDSGAIFFSQPVPSYLHPALYIDGRVGSGCHRFASSVSQYLVPARYFVIRLHPAVDAQYKHQLQSLRLLGSGPRTIAQSPSFSSVVAQAITALPGSNLATERVEPSNNTSDALNVPLQTPPGVEECRAEHASVDSIESFYVGNTYYPCHYSPVTCRWYPTPNFRILQARQWPKRISIVSDTSDYDSYWGDSSGFGSHHHMGFGLGS